MNEKELIEKTEHRLLHTYARAPLILERGEGMYLYDTTGKQYLDFASGIGVMGLGYGNKKLNDALKDQIDLLTHTSNLYYNVPAMEAAERLLEAADMDRVFFTNSGTEAIEGAIKAARKVYYTRTGKAGGEIIAMEHSFHGRSMGAVSVTGKEAYRAPFEPLIGGVRFAKFNDYESVEALVTEETCGILLETVQGEGGITPARLVFLQKVQKLCKERGLCLILDEIQCGTGRTGTMFAWQQYPGVHPDILTVAKAIGGGIPVGAFLLTEETAKDSLTLGDHGSTYGGNPFACRAIATVLQQFEELKIIDHVNEVAPCLWQKLDEIKDKFDFVTDHRGMGLMQGLELSIAPGGIIDACREAGLILITAGTNVLRFLPPLILEESHVEEMGEKLTRVLEKA